MRVPSRLQSQIQLTKPKIKIMAVRSKNMTYLTKFWKIFALYKIEIGRKLFTNLSDNLLRAIFLEQTTIILNLGFVFWTWQCIACGSFDITCTIFLTEFKVGLDYDGKVNLAVGNNKQFAGLLNGELGGDKSTSGKPMVVVLDENDKKYIMEEEFNSDMVSLRAFIDSYLAGNVEPFVKSEAVPESQVSLSFLRQILSMF